MNKTRIACLSIIGTAAVTLMLSGCGRVIEGPQGPAGDDGATGRDGQAGKAGASCSVTSVSAGDPVLPNGGALVLCPESSVLISNGSTGANGSNGENGHNGNNGNNGLDGHDAVPVQVVNLCSTNAWSEIALKLPDGRLIASFSDDTTGTNTRFVVLLPGRYMSTATNHCTFTVNNDYTISN